MPDVNTTVRLLVAGAAVAGVLLTGCGGPAENGSQLTVSKTKLQSLAKERLQASVKRKAKSVVCEDGIVGKVGATQRCVLTAMDGRKFGITAIVKGVEGDKLNIDFKADDKPMR